MDLGSWTDHAIVTIRQYLQSDTYWRPRLRRGKGVNSVHLAILVEPFLGYILDGTKTVESRFSTRQCAPFGRVRIGDIVLLKGASGPVAGLCEVSSVRFVDLHTVPIKEIRAQFGDTIRADAAFWKARMKSAYATILGVTQVRSLPPIACPKRDRRGWVVLSGGLAQESLLLQYGS